MKQEILSHTDYNILFENDEVGGVPVRVLDMGELHLPTGQIVACDPLVYPEMPPLTLKVNPGKYPVRIYAAETGQSGDRYALAKLEFSTKKADKWVLALREGEDLAELEEEGDFLGFPVDSGLGSLFDYESGLKYNEFLDDFQEKNAEGNIYDDFFADEFKKNARDPDDPNDAGDWVNYTMPGTNRNIIMFQSGYGDGVYPVYWGMTHENEIVSLVIDFFVLLLPVE